MRNTRCEIPTVPASLRLIMVPNYSPNMLSCFRFPTIFYPKRYIACSLIILFLVFILPCAEQCRSSFQAHQHGVWRHGMEAET